ncbi:hypothetical protein AVEN_270933-1 [Araneus ventricosus]|uniref:Uncharacterized protein n=1 Tax=Araneus ventricosus TaxID=182803 RepID=A0A4Y2R7Q3_ARAVE|nr:hypothetical protein AVEN_270933-1 [Araneus ventricosus]
MPRVPAPSVFSRLLVPSGVYNTELNRRERQSHIVGVAFRHLSAIRRPRLASIIIKLEDEKYLNSISILTIAAVVVLSIMASDFHIIISVIPFDSCDFVGIVKLSS